MVTFVTKNNQHIVGWSSLVAHKAHNLEIGGSNPLPATNRSVAKSGRRTEFKPLTAVGSTPTASTNFKTERVILWTLGYIELLIS